MSARLALSVAVAAVLIPLEASPLRASPGPLVAQRQNPARAGRDHAASSRAVRRNVPLTKAIQRALDAGTRDFTGQPGPNYWQLEVDYSIDVRLERRTQRLIGSETVVLNNNSPDELTQIVLRLDHNIFRPRVPRGFSVPAESTEGMVVTRLRVDGQEARLVSQGLRQTVPGALIASQLEQTVAVVSLPSPIAPHAAATLEIEWNTKLPGGPEGRGHRMTQRWDDRLFQPTQWFPRVAKYDDLRGWDDSVYLGPAEFYNNFGRFDVRIDVPGGWIVTGTGVLQNPEEVLTATARERLSRVLASDEITTIVGADEAGPGNATAPGDRLVWHFVADKVNDFAWATAENFVWQATRATIPGKGPVPIHMAYLPERAELFKNAGPVSRHALEFYSRLWAPYPFPQLTLQDGPSAGMEYPMFINSNVGAADHEVAHQWWPMMVGTNETWYGWMDEGFNTYMNILSNADAQDAEPDLSNRGQSYGRMSGCTGGADRLGAVHRRALERPAGRTRPAAGLRRGRVDPPPGNPPPGARRAHRHRGYVHRPAPSHAHRFDQLLHEQRHRLRHPRPRHVVPVRPQLRGARPPALDRLRRLACCSWVAWASCPGSRSTTPGPAPRC